VSQKSRIFKRSQVEIMGLAIIIILITLALIFVVRFVLSRKPADIKEEYTQAQLASNMINTLLRTTAKECSSSSFTELFQDCADAYPDGTIDCDTGEKSCSYLESKIGDIFDNTLRKWRKDYYFKAVAGTNTLVSDGNVCPGAKTHKEFPIPSSATTINIKLDICG